MSSSSAQSCGARREATTAGEFLLDSGAAAAGELQLDSGEATHGSKRHGSCSNEGRQLRIGGMRRIDPDNNSTLQAK
jgi:hypothetical protein